ncbi:MAG: SCO family protein [Polaromonas sp.]|nr:SCO family protein [Polaromonas sp.]
MDKNSSLDPQKASPTAGLLKTFALSLLLLLLGFGLLFVATNRGQAFTTEGLRRSEVSRQALQIPNFELLDAAHQKMGLHQRLNLDGRVLIVDFVYTRCQTICSALGSVYQQLQTEIIERSLQQQVGLLSISFDPANDDPKALQNYATRMRMDPGVWRIETLSRWQDRRRLLDSFGIMVVPAPLGEFEHNAALHLVNTQGQLVSIMDYDRPSDALNAALALAR